MGYIRHDAVIAIGYPRSAEIARALLHEVNALRAEMRSEMGEDESRVLVGPIETVVNGDVMYVYLPDGSKEGWSTSDRHDEWRDRFRGILARQEWWDVLSVRFGGDEPDVIQAELHDSGDGQ